MDVPTILILTGLGLMAAAVAALAYWAYTLERELAAQRKRLDALEDRADA